MDREASPYEVRCPRCDVSFPVGTRRCIHCGGPIAASPGAAAPRIETHPIEGGRSERAPTGEIGEEGAPGGIGSSLLKLSGSFFWIIALVIFSIVRNCGGEG